jgi:hypothetical protein
MSLAILLLPVPFGPTIVVSRAHSASVKLSNDNIPLPDTGRHTH